MCVRNTAKWNNGAQFYTYRKKQEFIERWLDVQIFIAVIVVVVAAVFAEVEVDCAAAAAVLLAELVQ